MAKNKLRVRAKMQAGIGLLREVLHGEELRLRDRDKVVFDAVQIHGGYGYTREYMVERLYRDSRILSIGGGTTEIMKEIVSKVMKL